MERINEIVFYINMKPRQQQTKMITMSIKPIKIAICYSIDLFKTKIWEFKMI
jgi:hypothetical protein